MEKPFNSYTFDEYPPTEILGEDFYIKSRKRLSFQYRDKNSDELLAFISLNKGEIPVRIPEEVRHANGCRILMADVRKIISPNNWKVKDINLLDTLLEEAEFYINGWCDTDRNNEFEFDYLWFDIKDFNGIDVLDIIERIDNTKQVSNYVYKVLKRVRYS